MRSGMPGAGDQGDKMSKEIPPNVQHQIQQFQQLQQQYEMIVSQTQRISLEEREIDIALAELEKSDEEKVYKNVGSLMIKAGRVKVIEELKSRKEEIGIRKQSLERQEKRTGEKLKELQSKLQSLLAGKT